MSHDLERVAALCDRMMRLHKGEVQEIGDPEGVTERYRWHTLDPAGP